MIGKNKILFINPVGTSIFDEPMKEYLNEHKMDSTEIEVTSFQSGPLHLEYYSYDSLVIPDILKKVRWAEKEGFDASIIGCFYDPGLYEAREVSNIIVTAPAESSMMIASSLGHKFSIIVGRKKWIPLMERNVINYGMRDRLASFESIDLGVYELHKDEEETKRRLINASKEAVNKGAEVLILGCTIFLGFYRTLQKEIGVPVIDPVVAALKYAELLLELKRVSGWSHSKIGEYESPPTKEVDEWGLFK